MVGVWLHVFIQCDYNIEATNTRMKLFMIVAAYVICTRVNKISTSSPHYIEVSVYSCVKYMTCMYVTKKVYIIVKHIKMCLDITIWQEKITNKTKTSRECYQ